MRYYRICACAEYHNRNLKEVERGKRKLRNKYIIKVSLETHGKKEPL
jgi:hypothetical protein